MRTPPLLALASVAAVFGALALGAGAQPDGGRRPDQRSPAGRPAPPAEDREALQRRLDSLREEIRRIEQALSEQDGAPPPQGPGRARPERRAEGGAPGAGGGGGGGPHHPERHHADRPEREPFGSPPDDGPPGQRARGPRERPAALSPEAEQRTLDFLREHNPEGFAKINALRERRPMIARRMLAELGGQLHELSSIRAKDPEMFDVRLRAFRTDWQLRETAFEYLRATRPAGGAPGAERDPDDVADGPAGDQAELRERLKRLVGQRFDLMLEERTLGLKRMGERLNHHAAELEEMKQTRDDAVAKRIGAMLERLDKGGPLPPPDAPR